MYRGAGIAFADLTDSFEFGDFLAVGKTDAVLRS